MSGEDERRTLSRGRWAVSEPLRDVVHIEIRDNTRRGPPWAGRRLGRHYLLTLSCGHLVVRSARPFRVAPHRCRCNQCQEPTP